MRVYLCGPVTGYSDLNMPVFEYGAVQLQDAGLEAVIPHRIVPPDATRSEAMGRCLRFLLGGRVDALAVLPGFSDSEGCRVEIAVADAVGVPVYPIDALLESAEKAGRKADGEKREIAVSFPRNNGREQAIRASQRLGDLMNNGYMGNGGPGESGSARDRLVSMLADSAERIETPFSNGPSIDSYRSTVDPACVLAFVDEIVAESECGKAGGSL